MMYLGGKARVAGHLAPFISERLRERRGLLWEPFVGGFNVVPRVYDDVVAARCSDEHPGLAVMWNALKAGWRPPATVDEEMYRRLKVDRRVNDPTSVFVSFACSFSGKEWGGFARSRATVRDYAAEGARSLWRKAEFVDRCEFSTGSYDQVVPEGAEGVVYCDPPYRGTEGYLNMPFDSDRFYAWCQRIARTACVLVSEFEAPSHWRELWSMPRRTTVRLGAGRDRVERLFEVVP